MNKESTVMFICPSPCELKDICFASRPHVSKPGCKGLHGCPPCVPVSVEPNEAKR